MTVRDALRDAAAALEDAGIDTPALDARLLLQWVLKVRREDLAREPDNPLDDRARLVFAKAVALRAQRRPLPYITGEQWFYGRPFKINRAVLIPRPETELLVAAALAACRGIAAPRIADIGTGSGCIGITLAAERADARVWATDISPLALNVARKNAARHGAPRGLTFAQGDLLAALPADLPYDVIVSNPPYIAESDVPDLMPEVRDYEPRLALSGEEGATGPAGTRLHQRILSDARGHLTPGGSVLLEVGQGQADAVAAHARAGGYTDVGVIDDLGGIGRVVRAHWTAHQETGSAPRA